MPGRREQEDADALDRLIELRRAGEDAAARGQYPSPDTDELARLAAALEDRWHEQPSVDENVIWQRVKLGLQDLPEAPAGHASAFLRKFRGWWGPRILLLAGATVALLLVLVATLAQREPASASFVREVEDLATLTAAVLNDREFSQTERGEVERRASALLATVEADPGVLVALEDRDVDLVAARLADALTLLEPYERDDASGLDTASAPLHALQDQVQSVRPGSVPPSQAPTVAPSPVRVETVNAETPTAVPRSPDNRQPTGTPTKTPRTTATPATTVTPTLTATPTPRQTGTPAATETATAVADVPQATPEVSLELDELRELCGEESGRERGQCRGAMARLANSCDDLPASERCVEAVSVAIEACRALRRDDTAAECERSIQLVREALRAQRVPDSGQGRRGSEDNHEDRGRRNGAGSSS